MAPLNHALNRASLYPSDATIVFRRDDTFVSLRARIAPTKRPLTSTSETVYLPSRMRGLTLAEERASEVDDCSTQEGPYGHTAGRPRPDEVQRGVLSDYFEELQRRGRGGRPRDRQASCSALGR